MSFTPARARTQTHRRIVVTAFKYLPELQEPPMMHERIHHDIGIGEGSRLDKVIHIPGIGWQLKAKQFNPGDAHEFENALEGIQTVAAGKLLLADGVEEKAVNRPPEGTGIGPLGYVGSLPMSTKLVAEGSSWNTSLLGSPAMADSDSDAVQIDWIAQTVDPHYPTEAISFRISVPSSGIDTRAAIGSVAFTGPAGSSKRLRGNGQYQVKLYGDGRGKLFERGVVPGSSTVVNKLRYQFRWLQDGNTASGSIHFITIISDAFDDGAGNWFGTKITFFCNSVLETGNQLINVALAVAVGALRVGSGFGIPIYKVPRLTNEPAVPDVARMGVRRDIRALFQIARHTYPTQGVLDDGGFSYHFYPTDRKDQFVEWYGNFPPATSINVRMFYEDETGEEAEIFGELTLSDQYGGVKKFQTLNGVRGYRLKFEFNSDGERTPTLKSWRLFRDGVTETPDVATQEIKERRDGGTLPDAPTISIEIEGPSHQANDDGASIVISDLTNRHPLLRQVSEVPVLIETTYNEGGDKAPLFYGYSQAPVIERKERGRNLNGSAATYPSEEWRQNRLTLIGFWRRLEESYSPLRFTWWDRVADKPMKVTDVIYRLLEAGGVPPSMIDVPDHPLRLTGIDGDELTLEPSSKVIDAAAAFARDYFGAFFIFDASAGSNGMVRMMRAQNELYPLATFYTGHPGNGKLSHSSNAYGSSLNGSQVIEHSYILSGSFTESWEPPEGNCVVVYGGGSPNAEAGETSGVQLSQCCVNVRSYNFLGLATDHPKYPRPSATNPDHLGRFKPIRVYDPSLMTQTAVDWVCRQVYLSACFSRKVFRFVAPLLLVTDLRDELQTKPRPLRTGDTVKIFEQKELSAVVTTTVVRRCSPFVDDAGNQWAHMECVSSKVIDDLGYFNWNDYWLKRLLRQAAKSLTFAGGGANTQGQKGHLSGAAAWMALPHPTGAPIQDLDPESATFGELLWALDFSPLG